MGIAKKRYLKRRGAGGDQTIPAIGYDPEIETNISHVSFHSECTACYCPLHQKRLCCCLAEVLL